MHQLRCADDSSNPMIPTTRPKVALITDITDQDGATGTNCAKH